MLGRLDGWLSAFEDRLAGVLLSVATILAATQVMLRYTVGFTFHWAEELVVVLVIWAVFVGSSAAVRRQLHIRVELLADILPPPARAVLRLITSAICLFFVTLVGVFAWQYTAFLDGSGEINPALEVPESWLYAGLPFGLALMSVRYLQDVVVDFRSAWPLLRGGPHE